MHRLVIHEYTPKVIGRCHCGHWETFQHRVRPIIGDNWIILYTGNPSYLRKQIIHRFQYHRRRHSPLQTVTSKSR